jgi:hypothetical protein
VSNILDIILTIVLVYMLLGVFTFLAYVMDVHLGHRRIGPVPENAPKSRQGSFPATVWGMILRWPLFLTVLLLAWSKKLTVTQWVALNRWRMREWIEGPDEHSWVSAFTLLGGDKTPIITHVVVGHSDGSWTCHRAYSKTARVAIMGAHSDVAKAKACADEDREWRRLCVPGNEVAMAQEWARTSNTESE